LFGWFEVKGRVTAALVGEADGLAETLGTSPVTLFSDEASRLARQASAHPQTHIL